tara:strand:- start:1214 stop:1612 length:399 start_codon:yes stop_codon:yes gene_type:complete
MQTTKNLIGIAESILAGPPIEEVPTPKNTIVDDGLKAVKVPDSYVDAILGFAGSLKETTETVPEVEKIDEAAILRERRRVLVTKLKGILKEARDLMQEMTTVGSLGTGVQKSMGMVRKKKGKNGSSKSYKRS